MKRILLMAAAIAATPVAAQVGPPPAPSPPASSPPASSPGAAQPVEPQRLAAATAVVEYLWPLGTYERMMRGTMDQMMDQMLAPMFDMPMGDIAQGKDEDGKTMKPAEAAMTLREAMAEADPHFQERMKITNRVMMEEMLPIMSRVEPAVRAGLARAYARKFSVEQLGEMSRFFATPAGGAFARESMLLWMDPEIMAAMSGFMPDMLKEMPRIGRKLEEATAHLPPPPAPPKERRKSRR